MMMFNFLVEKICTLFIRKSCEPISVMNRNFKSYKYVTEREKELAKEIETAIDALEKDVVMSTKLNNKTEKGWALMEAKLRKERLVALTAVSKFKLLLAEMEIFIAEKDLMNENLAQPENTISELVEDDTSASTSQVQITRVLRSASSRSSGSSSGRSSRRVNPSLSRSADRSRSPPKCSCYNNRSSFQSLASSGIRNNREEVEVMRDRGRSKKHRIATITSNSKSDGNFSDISDAPQYETRKDSRSNSSVSSRQRIVDSDTENLRIQEDLPRNTSSSNDHIEPHKSLTESIIEEFRESFTKVMAEPINSENFVSNNGVSRKRKKNSDARVFVKKSCIQRSADDPSLHSKDPINYSSITVTPMRHPEALRSSSQTPVQLTEPVHNVLTPARYDLAWPAPSTSNSPKIRYMPTCLSPSSEVFNAEFTLPTYGSTSQYESVSNLADICSPSPNLVDQERLETPENRIRHIAIPEAPMYRSKRQHRKYVDGQSKNEKTRQRKKKPKNLVKVKLGDKTRYNRTLSPTEVCFYNSS